MRFEEAYTGWQERRLTQEAAAELLGVCARTFRRHINHFEDEGMDGLLDKRMHQVSAQCAPVDEVMALEALYRERYDSWTVAHFYERYAEEHKGGRSYSWVKRRLQASGLVKVGKAKGKHRLKRERKPLPGMMLHQDGSTHRWLGPDNEAVWDLIVTMDDATSEVYSALFVAEEGTWSSFQGIRETLQQQGLPSSFYSDRGSHYWITPKAGGRVNKHDLTQFGRAMQELGIHMIPSYSPEARGRSERMFRTLQERLPKEMTMAGISDMDAANRFLRKTFLPRFNARFKVAPIASGSAFVPLLTTNLDDILCRKAERTVGKDNVVSYQGHSLQIPKTADRCHYARATVVVHGYAGGDMAVFHGPRLLAQYDNAGRLLGTKAAA